MGEKSVTKLTETSKRKVFIRHLLDDVKALEQMLEDDLFEKGKKRIGAEQEFCLINDFWSPSFKAMDILEDVDDEHFTTELAKYNLEINLDPQEIGPDCLSNMRKQLESLLAKAENIAEQHGSKVLLTGILPTIRKSELEFDYMTPNPRYFALNDMIRKARGTDFRVHLQGVDELSILHDSVLFEACNTSFQLHYQVDPQDFAKAYNWAMAISGPILAMCTNSPLLLGRELWSETRIALFQQSVDTRSSSYSLKSQEPRVTFGSRWLKNSITEIFKEDISRFSVLLASEITNNSLDQLDQGIMPDLKALRIHNGTIYRWNRPCYGVNDGVAHLRIENRYIPSGPSVIDEMANMAWWLGLMHGQPEEYDNLPEIMDFRDAKDNFFKAARTGKASLMNWMGGIISAKDLALNILIPIAREGLAKAGVSDEEANFYLNVIVRRIEGTSGSEWMVQNYRKMQEHFKSDMALSAITMMSYVNQGQNKPVHEWLPIDPKIGKGMSEKHKRVDQVMSTDLLTVQEDDLVDLVANIMTWNNIHHIPVEDAKGQLVGVLSWNDIQIYMADNTLEDIAVKAIMVKSPTVTYPEADVENASLLMLAQEIGCLPVVQEGKMVGIITKNDILKYQKEVEA